MTLDTDELVVGSNGRVWVAPLTATLPTDSDTALQDPWADLGYLTEDGATFTYSRTVESIRSWQSFDPTRRIVTERTVSLAFTMQQWNTATLKFALGGGTISLNGGEYTFTPPDPEDLDLRSLVLEYTDGIKDYRLVFPQGMVTSNVETQIVRNAEAQLPITFDAIPEAGSPVYTLITNDANMADLGTGS